MKKLYALLFATVISYCSYAQQQQGDLSIQFSGNFVSQKISSNSFVSKTFSGQFYVKIGKFFTPNIELGLKPILFFSPKVDRKVASDPLDDKTTLKTTAGFGIYGTYSFLTANAKFMPYGGAEVNYLPVGEDATVNLGPYVGIKYFVTETINVDANVNYLINLASTYGNDIKGLNISPLFQFNVGVGVLISKKD